MQTQSHEGDFSCTRIPQNHDVFWFYPYGWHCAIFPRFPFLLAALALAAEPMVTFLHSASGFPAHRRSNRAWPSLLPWCVLLICAFRSGNGPLAGTCRPGKPSSRASPADLAANLMPTPKHPTLLSENIAPVSDGAALMDKDPLCLGLAGNAESHPTRPLAGPRSPAS